MAEIPVERKSKGLPWWLLLLLGLLALLLFGLMLMRGCNDRTGVANTNTDDGTARITTQGVGMATGDGVTDVGIFGSTADKLSLAGRRVDLQNVRVNRVLSDRVFTVTAGSSEMFAMLNDNLNRGGMERQIKIQPGQMVNMGGTFQRVPSGEVKDETQHRDLNAGEYARMKDQQIYLHVTDVKNAK